MAGSGSGAAAYSEMPEMNNSLAGSTRTSFWFWLLAAIVIASFVPIFFASIPHLVKEWDSPDYSHGALIPLVSLFLIWRKRRELQALPRKGAWSGVIVLGAALVVALAGTIGTIHLLVHIAIVISLSGFVLAFFGYSFVKILWFPLFYLFFMIPLPDFFMVKLSAEMQLLSSSMGVFFIRLLDISVFLEGNVIDLGNFKMQVVEACNGLRYMFPLMSFGFLIGYLHKGPFWQRAFIFLSTIPITVVMNSARIAIIGAVFQYSGVNAAEGFLHDFEGWAVFIVCIAILVIELQIFMMLNRRKGRVRMVSRSKLAEAASQSGGKG